MDEYIGKQVAIDALTERNLVVHMDSVNDGLVASCHRSAQRIIANIPAANVVEKETVRQAFAEACQECRDACEEFDGFYADCNQCLLHGVKEKLKAVLEVAEQ